MALFVAVVAPNLVQVPCRSTQTILVSIIVFFLVGLIQLGGVDSGGRNRAFLASSILFPSAAVFLLPSSLSGRLRVTGAGSWQFQSPDLRFFLLGVFCQLALGTGLGFGRVGWLGALRTVLIYVFSGGPRS